MSSPACPGLTSELVGGRGFGMFRSLLCLRCVTFLRMDEYSARNRVCGIDDCDAVIELSRLSRGQSSAPIPCRACGAQHTFHLDGRGRVLTHKWFGPHGAGEVGLPADVDIADRSWS
jgi:hypothetical protein